MASEAFARIVEMLRAAPKDEQATIEQQRERMEAGAPLLPSLAEVPVEPAVVGGVPGEWVAATGASDAALIYLHGGAYVTGSPRTHRSITTRLSKLAGIRVLALDYRLAPEHPHPAAVDDTVAAYRALLDDGTPAARIAIAGDSAGGGLTIATLVAARDRGLPMPACAVLISPWLDMEGIGESWTSRADADPMLRPAHLKARADLYLAGQDARTPLAAPLYADLAGLPPVLVHVGDAEILLSDSTAFAARAEDAGVAVTLEVWDEMIHVWHVFAGLAPESDRGLERIADYLGERLAL